MVGGVIDVWRNTTWQNVARSLFLVFILFYLSFHAISGERGFYAWFKESKRLEQLKAELADITAKREAYEHRIKLLSSQSIDLDMLDEQARKVLGYTRPDEIVILTPKSSDKR